MSTHSLIFLWSRCNCLLWFFLGSVAFLLSRDTWELNLTLGWMGAAELLSDGMNPPSWLEVENHSPLPCPTLAASPSATGICCSSWPFSSSCLQSVSVSSAAPTAISTMNTSLFLLSYLKIPCVSVSPCSVMYTLFSSSGVFQVSPTSVFLCLDKDQSGLFLFFFFFLPFSLTVEFIQTLNISVNFCLSLSLGLSSRQSGQ